MEGSDKILVVVLSDVKAFVTSTIKKKKYRKKSAGEWHVTCVFVIKGYVCKGVLKCGPNEILSKASFSQHT